MKVMLDSNVIIAAFIARGLCQSVFELCVKRHEIVLCEQILREIDKVLSSKIKLPRERVVEIIAYLREVSEVSPDYTPGAAICTDPDDDSIIETAARCGAAYLVTGDDAVLSVGVYGDVKIVSPRGFWEVEAG